LPCLEHGDDDGSRDCNRLHVHGGRLPGAILRGGHLVAGGHVLVSAKRGEHVRNHARLRAGLEEAGFGGVKLMLLVVTKAHYLLICGLPGM
jgi:hypothetical protein